MKYIESINTSRRWAPGTNCQESASGSKNQRMMRMKMMYCKRPSPFIGSIIGVIEELVDLKKSYQELQKSSLKDIMEFLIRTAREKALSRRVSLCRLCKWGHETIYTVQQCKGCESGQRTRKMESHCDIPTKEQPRFQSWWRANQIW